MEQPAEGTQDGKLGILEERASLLWLELSKEADKAGGTRSHRAVVVNILLISF